MNQNVERDAVLKANIVLHNSLADTYNEQQPHFRVENKVRVSSYLETLSKKSGKDILVDFGSGTGFILELAEPFFDRLYGVDITRSMLAKIDRRGDSILLLESSSEAVPLADTSVNAVTANSFLHHLYDIRKTANEACRILKPGGVFFSEEDPNIDYWLALKGLVGLGTQTGSGYHEILRRELVAIVDVDADIASETGIDREVVRLAEYQKLIRGGMDGETVENVMHEVGFSKVNIEYYWFLGQANIMHTLSFETSSAIESYLHNILPLSKYLFKYFRIEAWK